MQRQAQGPGLCETCQQPLCSTFFVSRWTKGVIVSLRVHYGYYQGISAAFMPEVMRTNSGSVTVGGKCVGVFLFLRRSQ